MAAAAPATASPIRKIHSKVAIVGVGNVGASAAFAIVMKGTTGVRDLVLVDINKERALAEAQDIMHATPFASPVTVRTGEYPDIAGASVVVLCCGVGQRDGETRLQLLGRNAKIFQSVIPQVLQYAPEAVLVCVANPVDCLTHIATHFARKLGVPSSRVMGSGTMLDTARFRALLGSKLGIDAPHVHASVLGEHGDSEVLAWSQVTVAGLRLEKYCSHMGVALTEADKQHMNEAVIKAAYSIIKGKGSTHYGIASSVAKMVGVLVKGERAVLNCCSFIEAGSFPSCPELEGITLSLPHILDDTGIVSTIPTDLSDYERAALLKSAATLREALAAIELEKM